MATLMPGEQGNPYGRLKTWKRGAAAALQQKHLENLWPVEGSTTAVPFTEARQGQCRAIVAYENDQIENAIVCGEATILKLDRTPSSWCDYHHKRYMTGAKPLVVDKPPTVFKFEPSARSFTASSTIAA